MSKPDRLDQRLTAWLHEAAEVGAPGYLDETLELLARAPQRRRRALLSRVLPELPRPVVPRHVLVLALLALLLVALTAAVYIGAQRRLPAPFGLASNGLIAYDDGTKAYIAQADGSQAVAIQGGKRFNYNPTFSPDGTLVAFWSSDTGMSGGSLFVAAADGRAPARHLGRGTLFNGPSHVPPTWSPDSESIAYPGWSPSESGLFVASVETGEARWVAGDDSAGFPAWSPDGEWIAHRSGDDSSTTLTIVKPEGTGPRELVSVPGPVNAFTQIGWAPDSSAIVYHRPHEDYGGQTVIAVYDLEQGEHVVSRGKRYADAPTWSTDGRYIAYFEEVPGPASKDDFYRNLLVSTADGREHRPLGRVADCAAFWSPDSKYLISYAPGCFNDQLVIVPVEPGGGPVRSILLPGNIIGAPSWQRVAPPLW